MLAVAELRLAGGELRLLVELSLVVGLAGGIAGLDAAQVVLVELVVRRSLQVVRVRFEQKHSPATCLTGVQHAALQ